MFERFTDRARRVVVLSGEEARLLGHNYIGTEHILLGLIHEAGGVAGRVLCEMGASLEAARASVEAGVGRGEQVLRGHLPFTPDAKKVLESALRQALQLGHPHIGTEHLLLAWLKSDAVGYVALDGEGVRVAVMAFLEGEGALQQQAAPQSPRIKGDFCGQRQPHAAHVWQTPIPFGSVAFSTPRQCAGASA